MYNYVNIQTNVYMPRCLKKTFHENSVIRTWLLSRPGQRGRATRGDGLTWDIWGTDEPTTGISYRRG